MIRINGLKFDACHGVLDWEKVTPQPFVFDVALDFDAYGAMKDDDLGGTVDYSLVCEEVRRVCTQNTFNLIEKLAYACARRILDVFPAVTAATVTVHKPKAPVNCQFSDISFTCTAERVKAVLSLGSNMGDSRAILDSALKKLSQVDGVKLLKVSDYIVTPPYGGVATAPFLNCACIAECLIPARRLLQEIHKIEAELGRVRNKRWGDRTADIDIVFFGNKIIEEEGLCIPHPDYASRGFVLGPLKEIAPDFVCPLYHKRMADISLPNKA